MGGAFIAWGVAASFVGGQHALRARAVPDPRNMRLLNVQFVSDNKWLARRTLRADYDNVINRLHCWHNVLADLRRVSEIAVSGTSLRHITPHIG